MPPVRAVVQGGPGRMVDALQFAEAHGEVCPAGWQKGESGMQLTVEGVSDYLKRHADDL